MKRKLDTIASGIIAGLVGTFIGFGILGLWWAFRNDRSFSFFLENIAGSSLIYRDSILTVSTLFNVLLFYTGIKLEWWRFCRGLLIVILTSVPIIIWLQLQAGVS